MSVVSNQSQVEMTAETLYDLAEAKQLWPEERRIIYCGVTGKPWGIVSDEYVRFFIKNYGLANPDRMNEIIDRMTLFAGPSPMWQTKTPDMLVVNQHADPSGFLVYLLNWALRLETAARAAAKGDIEIYRAWRISMVNLYKNLQKIEKDFLHKLNDTILILSGEGLCPEPHIFPSRELDAYGDKATLTRLMDVCKKYYNRYGGKHRHVSRARHEIHHRTFLKTYSAEHVAAQQQQDLIKLMLVDLFSEIDGKLDKSEHKAAKKKTGIASAMFAELKELERDMQEKAAGTKPAMRIYQPGEKVTFKFGPKKPEEN